MDLTGRRQPLLELELRLTVTLANSASSDRGAFRDIEVGQARCVEDREKGTMHGSRVRNENPDP
jgi:hypothetical protein